MKKIIIFFLFVAINIPLIAQPITVGSTGDVPTLKEAFDAINNGDLTGDIILEIVSNTNEGETAVLNASGSGFANYTSVLIYPTGTGYTISGDLQGPLISLNGASNVTIDGRVNQSGSKDLTITNINTGNTSASSTIKFLNSAENNSVKYCILKGSEISTSSGIILFSTASSGNGNDGNTIDNNDITSYETSGRPINGIYSEGSSSYENSGNTISDNNIFNCLNLGNNSNGIYVYSNSSAWTISGNSFYEEQTMIPTGSYEFIPIRIDNSGTGFIITGNYIGGSSSSCSGTWTKSTDKNNSFVAIYIKVGTSPASSIQNNTIANFAWSNYDAASWTGIQIADGNVNVGTTTGNTIGASSGTGSITVTGSSSGITSGTTVYGIRIAGTGTVDCQNNDLGSIIAANATSSLASNFYGINSTGSGTITISNNTIGSTSSANSIQASSISSGNAQVVVGINNTATGTITISNNTVANLTNSTTRTSTLSKGLIHGIASSDGTNTISGNTIYELTIANGNNTSTNLASVCGISLSGITLKSLTSNTIYNLSNIYTSFAGSVIGIFFLGNTGANIVSGNFIHSLSVSSSSTAASIYGIKISSGATTYYNNIISLGGNTSTTLYGIYETGASENNNSLFFNTVYISGSVASGTKLSYSLYSAVTTNTRNFRNNIFVNARSTTGGSNLHYAAYIVSTGGTITADYNDYYVSGTGGTLGYYGGNKTALPIVTSQDAASTAANPLFANEGGTIAANYLPSETFLVAVTGTGITTDYDGGAARSSTLPSMGAFEYTVIPRLTWIGVSSTDWNTPGNWNYGSVPVSTSIVVIPDVTTNPTVNQAPASAAICQTLTINTGGELTVAAGKALTITGTLTNNGTLILKSSATGTATLIINSYAGTGDEQIELYLTGKPYDPDADDSQWHYISPPVSSVATSVFTVNTLDLAQYVEGRPSGQLTEGWVAYDGYVYSTWVSDGPEFTTLTAGKGYNYWDNANQTYVISGNLNTSNAAMSLSYGANLLPGFNLLGNPFTAGLDWNDIISDVYFTYPDNTSEGLYFTRDNVSCAYVGNVGVPEDVTGIIPPMQGFFIKTESSGNTITLPAAARTHENVHARYKKGGEDIPLVRLKLIKNNNSTDETVIRFNNLAKSGFDNEYDAYKMSSSIKRTQMYSQMEGTRYAINGQPFPETFVEIPLTINIIKDTIHSISATRLQLLENYNVKLKDLTNGFTADLKTTPHYSFSSAPGLISERFVLLISLKTTGVEDPLLPDNTFNIYSGNSYINIQTLSDDWDGKKGSVRIIDLTGKIVVSEDNTEFSRNSMVQVPFENRTGLYVVEIKSGPMQHTGKVVVR